MSNYPPMNNNLHDSELQVTYELQGQGKSSACTHLIKDRIPQTRRATFVRTPIQAKNSRVISISSPSVLSNKLLTAEFDLEVFIDLVFRIYLKRDIPTELLKCQLKKYLHGL